MKQQIGQQVVQPIGQVYNVLNISEPNILNSGVNIEIISMLSLSLLIKNKTLCGSSVTLLGAEGCSQSPAAFFENNKNKHINM